MIAPHRTSVAPYGTDDFAAHLAAREAALGIPQTTQDVTQVDRATGQCDASALNPQDAAPPLAGHTHQNCANCLPFAELWYGRVLRSCAVVQPPLWLEWVA